MNAQLKLVQFSAKDVEISVQQSKDPVRRVFDHWLFMFGRSPNRCKLDPARKAVISSALLLFDEGQLFEAIDGMAADPLGDCDKPKMRDAMRELEWLFARSSRIERWSDLGQALRMQAERRLAEQSRPVEAPPAEDAAADAAQAARVREQLRSMARARREAAHG